MCFLSKLHPGMAIKVLIVEDNPVARSFLCRVVRESFSDAIVITEAGDLESARRQIGVVDPKVDENSPDVFKLILVDLELPDGNGMELLTELVRYPATKIVTTLYSDDDHLFPALQCGADGYLLKEDRFEVLVEELQKIVRGQPPLSPAIARRLLSHFRQGPGGMGALAGLGEPALLSGSGFQSSRPLPLGRGAPLGTAWHRRLLREVGLHAHALGLLAHDLEAVVVAVVVSIVGGDQLGLELGHALPGELQHRVVKQPLVVRESNGPGAACRQRSST